MHVFGDSGDSGNKKTADMGKTGTELHSNRFELGYLLALRWQR